MFEYLLFYGHTQKTAGISSTCCSQWYPSTFEINGIQYPTAEHYMMAEKARLFGDEKTLQSILLCRTPKEAKALGRKVSNFDNALWQKASFDIVVKGNTAKFAQREDLRQWLLSTHPKVLVEASPTDRIWGIGIAQSDSKSKDPKQWKGRNQLGFALMAARDNLLKMSH